MKDYKDTPEYKAGLRAGREDARAEILAALKKTAEHQLRQAERLERKVDDDCERGSLMGYNYDGRAQGHQATVGAFEAALSRQGLDMDLAY